MRLSYATAEDLREALKAVNELYNDNIMFKRLDGKIFTLRVKDSKGAGARRGYNFTKSGERRRLISACWHVHGDFFEALFKVNPRAVVHAGRRKITAEGGNWQDWNIGSLITPLYHSEACDCA